MAFDDGNFFALLTATSANCAAFVDCKVRLVFNDDDLAPRIAVLKYFAPIFLTLLVLLMKLNW